MLHRFFAASVLALISTGYAAPGSAPEVVTRAELYSVIQKIDTALSKVLKVSPAKFESGNDDPAPAEEIIRVLFLESRRFADQFELSPLPQPIDPRLNFSALKPESAVQLRQLISEEFVPEVGPLAIRRDGLSPEELGDCLAFLIARIGELTHQPDLEFSPYLVPLPDNMTGEEARSQQH